MCIRFFRGLPAPMHPYISRSLPLLSTCPNHRNIPFSSLATTTSFNPQHLLLHFFIYQSLHRFVKRLINMEEATMSEP